MVAGEVLGSILPFTIDGLMQILEDAGAGGLGFLKVGIHVPEKHRQTLNKGGICGGDYGKNALSGLTAP